MSEAVLITDTFIQEMGTELEPVVAEANSIEITDNDGFVAAGIFLTDVIKVGQKKVLDHCTPICQTTDAAHKAATGGRATLIAPWDTAEVVVKGKLAAYIAEAERIRRLDEKLIEDKRIEEQRLLQVAATKAEEDRVVKHATILENRGDDAGASRVMDAPVVPVIAPPPLPPAQARPSAPKAKGISTRTVFTGEVEDFRTVVQACIDGDIPFNCIVIDQGKLDKHIQNNDGKVEYPGVRVTSEQKIIGRRKKT